MPFSFELHFDRTMEQTIRRIWESLAAAGICDFRRNGIAPHMTLAVTERVDFDEVDRDLTRFATSVQPFDITLEVIDQFPSGVIFAAPALSARLIDVHGRFHRQFALAPSAISPLYRPGAWRPHCTLAMNVEARRLAEALAIARRLPLPLAGRFEKLVAVRWPDRVEQFRHSLGTR